MRTAQEGKDFGGGGARTDAAMAAEVLSTAEVTATVITSKRISTPTLGSHWKTFTLQMRLSCQHSGVETEGARWRVGRLRDPVPSASKRSLETVFGDSA